MGRRLLPQPDKPPGERAGDPPTNPIGRPTTYRHEFCQLVLELADQGFSKAEIARELTTGSYEQLERWAKAFPEFRDALTRAREISLAYWERLARKEAGNRDFNSNLYRIAMMGRFSAEYRDAKVTVEQSTPSGVDLSLLSPEQREALAALLSAAKTQPSRDLPKPAEEPAKPAGMADLQGSVH